MIPIKKNGCGFWVKTSVEQEHLSRAFVRIKSRSKTNNFFLKIDT